MCAVAVRQDGRQLAHLLIMRRVTIRSLRLLVLMHVQPNVLPVGACGR